GSQPYVLVLQPALPARNLAEFIALAKAKPGTLNYGSAGVGSPPLLAPALFPSLADGKLDSLPPQRPSPPHPPHNTTHPAHLPSPIAAPGSCAGARPAALPAARRWRSGRPWRKPASPVTKPPCGFRSPCPPPPRRR